MVWSGFSILLGFAAFLIFIDHLGSRYLRWRVKKRAQALFSFALRQKNERASPPTGTLLEEWRSSGSENPLTIRLKIKGAKKSGKQWIPFEAKGFIAPLQKGAVWYADETLAPFVSRKWIAQVENGKVVGEQYRFLSVFPASPKDSHFPQLSVPELWFPWLRYKSGHYHVDGGSHEIRLKTDSQESVISVNGPQDAGEYHWVWSEIKNIDGWQVPTRLSMYRPSTSGWSEEVRHTLTEWSVDDTFSWW